VRKSGRGRRAKEKLTRKSGGGEVYEEDDRGGRARAPLVYCYFLS
jgi:hypothetical protein